MSQTKAQLIDTLVASLLPASDSSVDIGSNGVRFANIYGDTLYGDGSNLTGITSTTINSNADNRLITGSGSANTLNGESGLTYNGSTLAVTGAITGTGGLSIEGATVFNESGANVDFRVEGDADANLLFIDASHDRVGIGATLPEFKLDINGEIASKNASKEFIALNLTNNEARIRSSFYSGASGAYRPLTFFTGDNERLRIDTSGRLLIGHSSNFSGYALQVLGGDVENSSLSLSRFKANASSSILEFHKSRNNGIGSNTVVQNNDTIGVIRFKAADGTDYSQVADIQAAIDGTPGDNDTPGRLAFSTTADGAQYTTERMRIDSSGKVGIGTTSPAALLHLKSSSADCDLQVESTGSATDARLNLYGRSNGVSQIRFGDEDDTNVGLLTYDHTGNYMMFRTADAERMRIDSSGRVLIGTTTEGHPAADDLTISNSGDMGITLRSTDSNQGAIYFSDGTSGDDEYRGIINYNHASNFFSFYTNASERLRIDSSGRVGIGTTSPTEILHIHEDTNKNVHFTGGIGQIGNVTGLFAVNDANDTIVDIGICGSTVRVGTTAGERARFTGDGLCFNGDTAAANALDDYEEGTWTPSTTRWSVSESTANQGRYTKIGNFVQISWNQSLTVVNGGYTGNGSGAAIGGLPFAIADCAVVSFSNSTLWTSTLGSLDNIGSELFYRPNPYSSAGIATDAMFNSSGTVKITATYRTS